MSYLDTPVTRLVPIRRRWWEFWHPLWREEWRTYTPREVMTREGRLRIIRGRAVPNNAYAAGARVSGELIDAATRAACAKSSKAPPTT